MSAPARTWVVWEPGDVCYEEGVAGQGSPTGVCATTLEGARELWEDETCERPEFFHAWVARSYELTAEDIEDGEGWLDAEPGHRVIAGWRLGDGRPLASGEFRMWSPGWPGPGGWIVEPLQSCSASAIPVGTTVRHARLGGGRTTGRSRKVGGRPFIPVVFEGRDAPLEVSATTLTTHSSEEWTDYRVTIAGEVIADRVVGRAEAERILYERLDEMEATWEADQRARGLATPPPFDTDDDEEGGPS